MVKTPAGRSHSYDIAISIHNPHFDTRVDGLKRIFITERIYGYVS